MTLSALPCRETRKNIVKFISLMFAFILAILLIYLILAAQFESFKDPLIIMLTVPLLLPELWSSCISEILR